MSGSGYDRDAPPNLPVGENIGGYIVDGELGVGSMGIVYTATHPVIGKRAAIKVLRPELSENPEAVERFVKEARAVNQIGHRNIVNIFAFGTLPDGRSYYVMDLLDGESLHQRLKRGGPLHVGEAANIVDEIASALIAAHEKGIIHRDLKPENIFLVTVPGRWPAVSILDWGIVKLSANSAVANSKYRTLAGSLLGTPVYMSPEQTRGAETVDARTDIYSLGVIAYEILAGSVPFERSTSLETLLAHQEEPVPPLERKRPSVPADLVQLIETMLAKNREDRPTLAAVRAVIKRLQASKILTTTAAGLALPGGALGASSTAPPVMPQRAKPSTISGLPSPIVKLQAARPSVPPQTSQTKIHVAPPAPVPAEPPSASRASTPVVADAAASSSAAYPPLAPTHLWRTPPESLYANAPHLREPSPEASDPGTEPSTAVPTRKLSTVAMIATAMIVALAAAVAIIAVAMAAR